jgi:hypothetical protein
MAFESQSLYTISPFIGYSTTIPTAAIQVRLCIVHTTYPFNLRGIRDTLPLTHPTMCHNTVTVHRCGRHTSPRISYCRRSTMRNGRRIMCNHRTTTRTNQTDSLCRSPGCRHRQLRGVWWCCMCENGPNRYGDCGFVREFDGIVYASPCGHRPCDACRNWYDHLEGGADEDE